MRKILLIAVAGILLFSFNSCKDDKSQSEKDEEIIITYIKENNLDMTRSSSGIYYKIHNKGFGGSPTINSTVKVTYKGYLTDGTVFDQNKTGVSFLLSKVISGWQIAVPMLQKTGSGTFIIPSGLAYRDRQNGSIPANSVLIFDITLLEFN